MQQLLNWQKNPNIFLENLKKMKDKELGINKKISDGGIQEGNMDEGEEEKEEEDEEHDLKDHDNNNSRNEEELMFEENTMMEEEMAIMNNDKFMTMSNKILDNEIDEMDSVDLKKYSSYSKESIPNEPHISDLSKVNSTINPTKKLHSLKKDLMDKVKSGEKSSPTKKKEYTIEDAKIDLGTLAEETLEKFGSDINDDSKEMELLSQIQIKLNKRDLEGIKDLSDFFKSDLTMTYYEFSKSNVVKPLLNLLLDDNNSIDDIAEVLKYYYD